MPQSDTKPDTVALLADVGGTNARFALRVGTKLLPVEHLAVADYKRFDDALAAFLKGQALGRDVDTAVIAVAGPVTKGRAEFTNSGWTIDARALPAEFGFDVVNVINDFEAVARALPSLRPEDLMRLGGQEGLAEAPQLVLGPGTGLGVACLLSLPSGPFVFTSEAGHIAAPSWSRRTDAIIDFLRSRHGRVSSERLLSGRGLENLFAAIVAVDGLSVPQRTDVEITQEAVAGTCAASQAAVDLFFAMLGEVAGNLALAFGARGGVFIAGGIAPRLAPQLAASSFRSRFEDKGRLRPYLETIPCWLITHQNTAFLGLETIAAALTSSDLHP
jgi:glucokinase